MNKPRTRPKPKPTSPAVKAPSVRPWPQILGEIVLLALVLVIPIIINRYSRNFLDIKDAVLGIGVALGLSLWLIAGLWQGKLSWPTSRVNLAVALLLLWAAVSACLSKYWFVTLSEVGRQAANIGIFLLALVSLRSLAQARRVLAAACLAAVPVCLYAFLQATGHDFIQWKDPVVRVHSTLGNSTYLGGYTMLMIPLVAALAWPRRKDGRRASLLVPALLAVLIVMLVITLFLSFTLAAIAGLALGALLALALLIIGEGRKAIARALLVLALAAVVVAPVAYLVYQRLPGSQQRRVARVLSLEEFRSGERLLHWQTAYHLFKQKPVTGWGYGAYRVESLEIMAGKWYRQTPSRTVGMLAPGYAHNEPLQILADTGLIGGAFFLLLVLLIYRAAFRVSLRHPDAQWRRLGLAITAAITGFFFQNLVGVTFHQTGTVTFFWLWLALLVLAESQLPGRAETAQPMRLRTLRLQPNPIAAVAVAPVAAALVALIAWASIRPAIANVTVREAQVLAGAGHQQAAIAAANRTLELCPYSALAYYTLAFSYGNLGDYDQALKANLKSLELMPGNGSALYNLGVVYKQMGRIEEATETFRKAIAVMPSSSTYAGLAEMLLTQGKLAEAEEQARLAAACEEELATDPAKQAQLYLLLADIAFRRKEYEKMLDYSRQAAVLQPTEAKVQSNLLRLLMALKREEEAAEVARAWAQADPQAAQAHFVLGIIEYNRKDFRAARQHLSKAVELAPSDWDAHLYLAYTLGQLRDLNAYRRELQYLDAHGGRTRQAATARKLLAKLPPP